MAGREGISFLSEYRMNPKKYLPMTDKQYKHFDEWEDETVRNMCWDAGLLQGNRPYFVEVWKVFGVTTLTVTVTLQGTEPATVVQMIQNAGLIECINPEKAKINLKRITEESGKEFIGVNTVISEENDELGEQFVLWKGKTETYDVLNDYNEKWKRQKAEKDRMNKISTIFAVLCVIVIAAIFLFAPDNKEEKAKKKAETEQWIKEYWETHPTTMPSSSENDDWEKDDDYYLDRALDEAYEGMGAYDDVRGW